MAGTSSAGLPHRTCRSDAGQFLRRRAFRPDLAPEAVRALAAQVLHATVAEHDRTYTEPAHPDGTARALDRVMTAREGGTRRAVEDREAERGLRESRYCDALTERRLGRSDLDIVEGEVVLPREVAECLRRDPSSLAAPDGLAVIHAPLMAPEMIPSEIDALLAANGLRLPPDHPSRGPMSLAVARAPVQAVRNERARADLA